MDVDHAGLDEDLHSRQIAVYGREAMSTLSTATVLVSGINGLGVEIGRQTASSPSPLGLNRRARSQKRCARWCGWYHAARSSRGDDYGYLRPGIARPRLSFSLTLSIWPAVLCWGGGHRQESSRGHGGQAG